MSIPRRIVRFYACEDDSKSQFDANASYYGVLDENQTAQVGANVNLLNYGDIYDASSYKVSATKKKIGKILAPIDVANIFCIGLNYKFHASESQMALPKNPVIFSKPTTSVCAHNEDIILPKSVIKGTDANNPGECDYEVELVIIIGKQCKNVSEQDALQYVFGYTVANDVSARQWQLDKEKSGGQWIRGKSFDTFCPLGPCVLLQAAANVDAQNLNLYCKLNGKTVQNSNTKEMIFGITKLVSFISQSTTLLPGTIILSGTPDGVGFARKPPLWLKNGDNVVVGVEGIGELVNDVKDEYNNKL
mmetsp:Transcript_62816/g.99744  ORF Transcript_62816/g.99744 Transcript_62816/m.99744 type:complete len:304 (+) Transcript_62816:239-1150(+)